MREAFDGSEYDSHPLFLPFPLIKKMEAVAYVYYHNDFDSLCEYIFENFIEQNAAVVDECTTRFDELVAKFRKIPLNPATITLGALSTEESAGKGV